MKIGLERAGERNISDKTNGKAVEWDGKKSEDKVKTKLISLILQLKALSTTSPFTHKVFTAKLPF